MHSDVHAVLPWHCVSAGSFGSRQDRPHSCESLCVPAVGAAWHARARHAARRGACMQAPCAVPQKVGRKKCRNVHS
jgi:hypothetical protein